MNELMKVRMAG